MQQVDAALAASLGHPVAAGPGRPLAEVLPSLAPDLAPLIRQALASAAPALGITIPTPGSAGRGAAPGLSIALYPLESRGGFVAGVDVVVHGLAAPPSGAPDPEQATERANGGSSPAARLLRLPVLSPDDAGGAPGELLDRDGHPYAPEAHPLARALRGELLEAERVRYRQADGSLAQLDVSAAPVRAPDGSAVLGLVVFEDIGERERLEAALRSSEARFRLMADNAPVMIWITEPDGTCTYLSEGWYAFTGQTPARGLGLGWLDAIHPEDRARAEAIFLNANASHAAFRIDYRLRRRDGVYRWVIDSAAPRLGSDDAFLGYIGSVLDVTEQKLAEERRQQLFEELRSSEERYRNLLDSIDQGFCIFEMLYDAAGRPVDYRFLTLNPTFERHTGLRDAVGKTARELVPGLEEHWFAIYGQVAETGTPLRFEQGSAAMGRWFEVDAVRVGGAGSRKVALLFTDISARRQAEADARFLSELGEQIRVGADADVLLWTVAEALGRSLPASRCCFIEVDDAADRWMVHQDYRSPATLPAIAGAYRLAAALPDLAAALRAGRVIAVSDLARDPLTAPLPGQGATLVGISAVSIVPLLRAGRLVAAMAVVDAAPRDWAPREIALLETVAERTWNAVEQLRAAEVVRASQTSLALALQAGQAGTFEWDIKHDLNRWSPELEALYGVPPGTFEGNYQAWFSRTEPADARMVEAGIQDALRARRRDYVYEFRAVLPDGNRRWLAGRARFEYEADGSPLRMRGINVDIDARKRDELNNQFLLDLDTQLNSLTEPGAIEQTAIARLGVYLGVTCCFFGHIDGAEVAVRHEWRAAGPSALGVYPLDAYFSPEALAQLRANLATLVDDVSADPRTAAGADRHAALAIGAFVSTPVVHHGRWVGALNIASAQRRAWRPAEARLLRDVAARVWPLLEQAWAHVALRASEARLQLLYAQEQAARAQAEEASRLKDEFLATVSHELRTPLTAFLGYAELVQRRRRDEAYVARTVEKMVQSARTQAQLIEDLLDVSRIVSGKLRIEPQPIDLAAPIEAALDTVRPAAEARGITMHTDLRADAGTIIGDASRLQQVVWNLLANAVKFTPPGGRIDVRLEPEGRDARLTVSDTGQGISPRFLPYVFDRFRQADSTSQRAHGGLGLGLAIVRHLVELHGGTVQAHSPGEGQGATMTVRLPLAFPAAGPPAPSELDGAAALADCPPELHGLRVLVVDDQPPILDLLHEILAQCGAVVRVAPDGHQALAAVRAWRPDLLISDIAMPGADGFWLIRQVRALAPAEGGATPAIALTAYVRMEDRVQVLAAGFQLYVPKPIDPTELRDVVAGLARTAVLD